MDPDGNKSINFIGLSAVDQITTKISYYYYCYYYNHLESYQDPYQLSNPCGNYFCRYRFSHAGISRRHLQYRTMKWTINSKKTNPKKHISLKEKHKNGADFSKYNHTFRHKPYFQFINLSTKGGAGSKRKNFCCIRVIITTHLVGKNSLLSNCHWAQSNP